MRPVRLPVVGVMGSSRDEHVDLAEPLGDWLAHEGVHLLTGAGAGVMTAVSRAFAAVPTRRGLVIGVVPGEVTTQGYRSKPGYPNDWIDIVVRTHLPLSGERGTEPMSRNHVNVLSADVVVALPGGHGTSSEVELALRYGRPVIAHVHARDEIPGLPESVTATATLSDVQRFVRAHLSA